MEKGEEGGSGTSGACFVLAVITLGEMPNPKSFIFGQVLWIELSN
jgi:hypothetical protein